MNDAAEPSEAWLETVLEPFRTGVFRSIWIASLASNVGTLVQAVGAAWLMTSLVKSSDMVALVQAASALPIMLLSIPAGAVADIWDRRALMLLAQGLMGLTAVVLTALAFGGGLGPWSLLAFTFLLGCGSALYGPAWQSSVGEQVPLPQLPAAVSLNAISFNIARTIGPALGGLIVASAGVPAAFLVNACSYAGLIVVLLRWRRPHVPRALPPESIGAALGAGLRYAHLSPALRIVLLRSFVFGLFASALWATFPLVARDLLHGGPLTFGFLLGGFGLGAVLAALGSAWLRRRYSADAITTAGAVAYGVATVVIAESPWLLLSGAACLIAGSAWVLSYSTFNIAIQISSPRWVVGRTLAIYQTAAFGGIFVGAWLFAEYVELGGLIVSLLTAGLLQAGSFVLARRWPLHPAVAIDMDPLTGAIDDHARAAIDPEAGPIVISVEYRVATADAAEFVRLAHELGRIRRRDGARRWILLQDLDDPRRWLERFETVTWLDHLRQSQRRTVADQGVRERLAALHQAPGPPRVHHLLGRSPDDAHGALGPGRLLARPEPSDPRLAGDVALPPRAALRETPSPPDPPGATGPPRRH
jgi:predicted MFS family arabinose efflux permease